jgi:hypothetical protein
MRVNALAARAILVSLLSFSATAVRSEVLITAREAKLPSDDSATRDVYLGPKVVVVSPSRGVAVKSPFDLKIEFERRGDVDVDLNSLAVTYRKIPPVDLTERLKEFATPSGIDMSVAEAPAGRHRIHIEIKDVNGRLGGTNFSFDVAP